jgi:transposase
MAGKSPLRASNEQKAELKALALDPNRAEADRARAVLLTVSGWTSARIAEAFGVREDTVRLRRSDFMRDGIDGLKASVALGPVPLKAEAALRVASPLLVQPVADRRNWTLARLAEEIRSQEGISISQSLLSGNFAEGMRQGIV